jgi:protein-L-isoaspartate(D-aspartate) O-methyltransferase
LLDARRGDKVLEIGTGCGYQTAVLCAMGLKPYSIERIRPLHLSARKRLEAMGYRPQLFFGDGFKGAPAYAPFDRVLVTCGAPGLPATVLQQVRIGGRIVIPVGAGDVQTMIVLDRKEDGQFQQSEHGQFRFVPMLSDRRG